MKAQLAVSCLIASTMAFGIKYVPATTPENCDWDESSNKYGNGTCNADAQCQGDRYCDGSGYCYGASNCPDTYYVGAAPCSIDET